METTCFIFVPLISMKRTIKSLKKVLALSKNRINSDMWWKRNLCCFPWKSPLAYNYHPLFIIYSQIIYPSLSHFVHAIDMYSPFQRSFKIHQPDHAHSWNNILYIYFFLYTKHVKLISYLKSQNWRNMFTRISYGDIFNAKYCKCRI
jgi:hypothetical protein